MNKRFKVRNEIYMSHFLYILPYHFMTLTYKILYTITKLTSQIVANAMAIGKAHSPERIHHIQYTYVTR